MSVEEFGRHYHHILFKNACHERKGTAFQTFFEQIMMKHDTSFIAVKPAGKEGDWKCDGFSTASGTVYQCYAPEGMKIAPWHASPIRDILRVPLEVTQFEVPRLQMVQHARLHPSYFPGRVSLYGDGIQARARIETGRTNQFIGSRFSTP